MCNNKGLTHSGIYKWNQKIFFGYPILCILDVVLNWNQHLVPNTSVTHIFDEKSMQHDISEAIILQGGEQGWLLEHKHCHNLRRYEPERQKG